MKHARLVYEVVYVIFEAVVVGVFGIFLWAWDGCRVALQRWRG
jgi:hypothetical protein